jgi:hypothetical protein
METFTEAYQKGASLLKGKCFDARWSHIEARIKALLAPHGPNDGAAGVLDLIRDELEAAGEGEDDQGDAVADEMLDLCRAPAHGFQDRAALLEMLRHFYLVKLTDNHRIWILDAALSIDKWVYDEFDGETRHHIKRKLAHQPFTAFDDNDRQLFGEALHRARKWSMDAVSRLGHPDQDTRDIVKRWFHSTHASEDRVKKTAKTLLGGFKKISVVCNSTNVIFSDDPSHRRRDKKGRLWLASVTSSDKMPVIYIYPGFLPLAKKNVFGRFPKMWLAALTIIHELSHKVVDTDDLQSDDDGIKPGASISSAASIKNADSWAYFITDLVGALPDEGFKEAYK